MDHRPNHILDAIPTVQMGRSLRLVADPPHQLGLGEVHGRSLGNGMDREEVLGEALYER